MDSKCRYPVRETTFCEMPPFRSPVSHLPPRNRLFRARDRWFESVSLQERVGSELGADSANLTFGPPPIDEPSETSPPSSPSCAGAASTCGSRNEAEPLERMSAGATCAVLLVYSGLPQFHGSSSFHGRGLSLPSNARSCQFAGARREHAGRAPTPL
jgi:hypothetical protein